MYSANIDSWVNTVWLALANSLTQFLNFLPKLVAAILIFAIGLLIANLVKAAVTRLLSATQLEPFAERVGMGRVLRSMGTQLTAKDILGEIVRWSIILIFLLPASEVLGLNQLSELIDGIIQFIPNVIIAVLVLMVGAILADILGEIVGGTSHAIGASTANVLAVISKYAVIVFSVLVALSELRVAPELINTLVTGFVAMLALAGGLAFGLGGKDTAAELLATFKRNLQEKR
jgi:hypothetical protein